RQFQNQQSARARLEKTRGETESERVEAETRGAAFRQQAASLREQAETKRREADGLKSQLAAGQAQMAENASEFSLLAEAAEAARRSGDWWRHWINDLDREIRRNQAGVELLIEPWKEVASWDDGAVARVRAEEARLDRAAHELALRLAETRRHRQTLT